jgi:hypothetical protein
VAGYRIKKAPEYVKEKKQFEKLNKKAKPQISEMILEGTQFLEDLQISTHFITAE